METSGGSSSHGQEQQQHISFAMIHPSAASSSMHAAFMRSKEYDLGELDQALFMYLDQDHNSSSAAQEQRRAEDYFLRLLPFPVQFLISEGCEPETLNIFPSQPMHVEPTTKGGVGFTSPTTSDSKNSSEQAAMEFSNARSDDPPALTVHGKNNKAAVIKKEGNRRGTADSSEHEGRKTPDPKTLRRLAQNREAARKSRLRKKAYIQQLETSRIKLTQLEQELHRTRTQGILLGGGSLMGDQGLATGVNGLISDEAIFDIEYSRWQEEHHRLMCELRAAVHEHLPENELRMLVDSCIAHHDLMMHLKSAVIKSDVFHLISGMWMTPAERCFMWIGGFRPSELIKMLLSHIEPLTEQQIVAVCGMQQSMHEAEEALSQGLEALNQSLSHTITSDALSCPSNMANYMSQMAVAINKLTTLEGFVRQADSLRQQTLHRLHQILTTRQMARCLLAMAEYFHRLRALSSLWLARPRNDQ